MNSTVVKPYTHGLLKDGRRFQIKEINKLHICEDGSIHSGAIIVEIEGRGTETYTVSEIAENIDYGSLPAIKTSDYCS